jgi:hypothetical protein
MEVGDHYVSTLEGLLASGTSQREAEAAAVASLGSPRAARRHFHRECLTRREAAFLLNLQGKRHPDSLGVRGMSRGRWASVIAGLLTGVWLPLYIFPSPYAIAFMACIPAVLALLLLHVVPSPRLDSRVRGRNALLLRMLLLHMLQLLTLPILIGMLTGAFDRLVATLPAGEHVLPFMAVMVLIFQLPVMYWHGRLTWKLLADPAGILYRDLLEVAWRRHPAPHWWERSQ